MAFILCVIETQLVGLSSTVSSFVSEYLLRVVVLVLARVHSNISLSGSEAGNGGAAPEGGFSLPTLAPSSLRPGGSPNCSPLTSSETWSRCLGHEEKKKINPEWTVDAFHNEKKEPSDCVHNK